MEKVMRLPPGFRFHPTDEELVEQYLKKKVFGYPLPASIIPDIELFRYDPWDLPAVGAGCSDKERYFFNWRETKYRVGNRCNRAAGTGYWKVTGKDGLVTANRSNRVVGMKRILVFYRGRAPRGSRTDWVMHEYRLAGLQASIATQKEQLDLYLHKEEDWVLCRVFKKRRAAREELEEEEEEDSKAAPVFFHFMPRSGNGLPASPANSESSCVTSESSCVTSESSEEEDSGGGDHGSSLCLLR